MGPEQLYFNQASTSFVWAREVYTTHPEAPKYMLVQESHRQHPARMVPARAFHLYYTLRKEVA